MQSQVNLGNTDTLQTKGIVVRDQVN